MVVIFSNESTETLAEETPVAAYVDRDNLGNGVLTVSESCVRWCDEENRRQMELQYEHVMLHAVSQETANFPHHPHLYLMVGKEGLSIVSSLSSSATEHVEQSFRQLSTTGDSGEVHHVLVNGSGDCPGDMVGSGDSDSCGEGTVEIRFVPGDSHRLSALFEALNRGQSANPDPDLSLSDCDEMSGDDRVNGVNVDVGSDDEETTMIGINGSASDNHPTDPKQFEDDDVE